MGKYYPKACILYLMLFLTVLCQPVWSRAEAFRIDQQEFIAETQQMKEQDEKLTFIWWMAEPFWEIELSKELQSEQLEAAMEVFSPYIIVGALDGTVGPFGGFSTMPEDLIRENIYLVTEDGTKYAPLNPEDTSEDMKNFLRIMKPILASMLGQFGQGLNFIVFPSRDSEGHELANVREEGRISVVLAGEPFTWRLPLASVLPKKTCRKCGELLQGNFKYCPWDGSKL